MVYFLTFRIDDKNGMSACFTPRDAIDRHNDLLGKGAIKVGISQDGEMLSLAEVEAQLTINQRYPRPEFRLSTRQAGEHVGTPDCQQLAPK